MIRSISLTICLTFISTLTIGQCKLDLNLVKNILPVKNCKIDFQSKDPLVDNPTQHTISAKDACQFFQDPQRGFVSAQVMGSWSKSSGKCLIIYELTNSNTEYIHAFCYNKNGILVDHQVIGFYEPAFGNTQCFIGDKQLEIKTYTSQGTSTYRYSLSPNGQLLRI